MKSSLLQAVFLLCGFLLSGSICRSDDALSAEEHQQRTDFFEAKIRPRLVEHCTECHATDSEASGGLLLDSRAGWMKGGDSGASVVVGDAATSRLIRAISYDDPNLQMPPEGKLPDKVIADFKQWINDGAIDPRVADASPGPQTRTGLPVERAQEHWSYRSVSEPRIAEAQPLSPRNAIDFFIHRQQMVAGIPQDAVGGEAPRDVLARRLYFDLTGLPPTPQELSDFLADESEAAYARLVDKLLASPRFGETFARRWMDVVRYADSITLRGFVLPQAWRYRDYLIESYNDDRSFATMIREQIAGDQLTAADYRTRTQQLVATSFWALGNTNLEQQDKTQLEMDYIDEQLEVMGRAFLGQTIGCARCHDHKFDPIPTKDYYALAGILRSTVAFKHDNVSKWIDEPLPLSPAEQQHYDDLANQRSQLAARIAKIKGELNGIASSDVRVIPIRELAGTVIDSEQAKLVGNWVTSSHIGPIVGGTYIHDENTGKGQKTATLEPTELAPGRYEVRFAYTSSSNRTSRLAVKVFSADGEATVMVNQRKPTTEDGLWVSLGEYRFEENGQAYVLISNEGTDGHVIVDAVQFLPQEPTKLAEAESAETPPVDVQASRIAAEELNAELKKLESRQKRLDAELASRPHYLTILEKNQPQDIPIHVRGDVHNLGEVVPRGVLTALNHAKVELSSDTGGRLELANWIADSNNPLTARVYANRVWSWLMGQGLVSTVNNFGTTGTLPTHPELLDWLAVRLCDSDWSTKSLVREIVTSDAYRRALVQASPEVNRIDPENRLFWRGNARRLTVESLRDSMLMISGELDLSMGDSLIAPGVKADYNYQHRTTRRSIYHPVFRNSLPELYEAFDFADTSVSVGQRPRSTVAPQALVLMNHPWVIARAEHAAHRVYAAHHQMNEDVVRDIYAECLSRQPSSQELEACMSYLQSTTASPEPRIAQLIQTLFTSLDFRFLE